MNDIERRALIGAAGIGAIAALAKAGRGPLDPPAGAVAPTGRTTDEIYNKIPATFPPVGGYDGRIPIPGGSGPVTINTPGSYVLTGNLTGTATMLTIAGAGINIDLNGFRVSSTSITVPTISVGATCHQLVLRNGTVSGGYQCISIGNGAIGVLIEGVIVSGAKYIGIQSSGNLSQGLVIRRCAVYSIGTNNFPPTNIIPVLGISIGLALGCRVESCTVSELGLFGGFPITVRGIQLVGRGGSIDGCIVSNTSQIFGSLGLEMGVDVVYRNNKMINVDGAYISGQNGGGNF